MTLLLMAVSGLGLCKCQQLSFALVKKLSLFPPLLAAFIAQAPARLRRAFGQRDAVDRRFLHATVTAAVPTAVTLRHTMRWLWLGGQAKDDPAVEALAGEVFETGMASAWRVGWGEEGGHSVRR